MMQKVRIFTIMQEWDSGSKAGVEWFTSSSNYMASVQSAGHDLFGDEREESMKMDHDVAT